MEIDGCKLLEGIQFKIKLSILCNTKQTLIKTVGTTIQNKAKLDYFNSTPQAQLGNARKYFPLMDGGWRMKQCALLKYISCLRIVSYQESKDSNACTGNTTSELGEKQ
jgi:hypothetical protein